MQAASIARLALLGGFLLVAALARGEFLAPEKAFQYHAERTDEGGLVLNWDIADGYYLYRDAFDFSGEPDQLRDVSLPDGEIVEDDYFGKSEVYFDSVSILVAPGGAQTISMTWQGCALAGLCYPPQSASLDMSDLSSERRHSAPANASAPSLAEDQHLAGRLASGGLFLNVAIFFGFGLLLAFTPCVLPMLPVVSALVVGQSVRGWRGVGLALAYVLPMAMTYAVLGVATALAGASMQAVFQHPFAVTVIAALFVVLALSMFDVFTLQMPAALRDRFDRLTAGQRGGTLLGAAAMGVVSAVLVGPCMTAPLAGALLYIAESGDAWLGGAALFALGLGMGLPLVLVASLGARLLPRPGMWMVGVKAAFGFMLLGMALWFSSRLMPEPLGLLLWSALFMLAGLLLRHVGKQVLMPVSKSALIASTAGAMALLWAVLLMVGAALGARSPWQPLAPLSGGQAVAAVSTQSNFMSRFESVSDEAVLEQKLREAASARQWVLIDFYADWCVVCHVIEAEVFGDPQVQQALEGAVLLRPDVTANDQAARALMRRYSIIGPPALLIIGPDGQERRGQRVIGGISASEFLERWHTARVL
ncbi:MAG: protein-disulfide reductase DsbD [Alcanivorax sp.]|nr:protein-disulfide reductase DsbD [Alcanivorax sp.]